MIHIWWPAFIVPVLMIIGGLLGRHIPGLHYRSPREELTEERQRFADNQLFHTLWQFGFAFAALAFMTMGSVRLMPENGQRWLLYGAVILEVLGVLLMALPIERALQTEFEEETQANKGEDA